MLIKNILKNYTSHQKIIKYKHSFLAEGNKCNEHSQYNCMHCYPRKENNEIHNSSVQRSKTLITDYTLMNNFDMFCTFTFDPKKTDSTNIEETKQKMSNWLKNQKRKSPFLMYLIVAEKHKKGRIHFHALFKNYKGTLSDSGKKSKNRKIYNTLEYKLGWNTIVKIDNIIPVAYYMQKYITKDMLKISNKKRFWVSRNLQKPEKQYNINIKKVIENDRKIIVKFQNDNFTILSNLHR